METIDAKVLSKYNDGIERGRLRSGLGLIEFARTKELLDELLPKPPATIYDIGGGYGEYSWHMASLGYDVHLFDIAERNIEMSAELAAEYPGCRLHSAEVADAVSIDRASSSADAILLMGPLYHIVGRGPRMAALRESRRLLRPGGVLFSAAITRYATTLWAMTTYGVHHRLLEEDAFCGMIHRELQDGVHQVPADTAYTGMGYSFFHTPDELAGELAEAGFTENDVRGVIGCGWLVPNLDAIWNEVRAREAIMEVVRRTDREPSLLGLSTHLLAISR